MTRINCVPVEELTDKHLGGEYTEITRVFVYALKSFNIAKEKNKPIDIPLTYRMETGHVKFFYNKLNWVLHRYYELYVECLNRGRNMNEATFKKHVARANMIMDQLPAEWARWWYPTEMDKNINRKRINERLS